VGYSINDTVVVFDRVRENLRKFKQMPLIDVLNLSVNETLSRTLMTSGTTLIALFALYMLGGEVLRGFTFAMMWGIVIGTYSSIFVAAAVLLWLGVKRDWSKPGAEDGGPKGAVRRAGLSAAPRRHGGSAMRMHEMPSPPARRWTPTAAAAFASAASGRGLGRCCCRRGSEPFGPAARRR
jgi:hypothetical protein